MFSGLRVHPLAHGSHQLLRNGFDQLEVGSEVRYSMADEEGPMGPQASRVRVVKGGHALR